MTRLPGLQIWNFVMKIIKQWPIYYIYIYIYIYTYKATVKLIYNYLHS